MLDVLDRDAQEMLRYCDSGRCAAETLILKEQDNLETLNHNTLLNAGIQHCIEDAGLLNHSEDAETQHGHGFAVVQHVIWRAVMQQVSGAKHSRARRRWSTARSTISES